MTAKPTETSYPLDDPWRWKRALERVLEVAEDREDVEDSSGGPQMNDWMRIAMWCRWALGRGANPDTGEES